MVGTYALILQSWLPLTYIAETIDIFVDNPTIVFDEGFERRILGLALSVGRSEAGGLYVGAEKPIEIIYPIHDIYIPRKLLRYTVSIDNMEVLEGHAAIIAKAIGNDVKHLTYRIKAMGITADVERLYRLLKEIEDEIELNMKHTIIRRVKEFVEKLQSHENREG